MLLKNFRFFNKDMVATNQNSENAQVTILSGALGTGKTTILEHLVPQMEEEGKTGGIVNDKDIINNDAETLNQLTSEEVGEVTVDCACCGAYDKVEDLLDGLSEEGFEYDNFFFEPTGQANAPSLLEAFEQVENAEIDQFAHTVPIALYDKVRSESAHMSGLAAANTVVYTHNSAETREQQEKLQENYQLFMEDLQNLGKDSEKVNFVQMNDGLTLDDFRQTSWNPGFMMDIEEGSHDDFEVYSANLSPETGNLDEVIEELAEMDDVRRVEAYTGDRKIDVSGDQISEKQLDSSSSYRISVQYESPDVASLGLMGRGPDIEDPVESKVEEVEAEPWEIPTSVGNAPAEQVKARFEDHITGLGVDSEAMDTAFELAKEYDSRVVEPELVEEVARPYIQDRMNSVKQLDASEPVERAEAVKYLGDVLMFDGVHGEEFEAPEQVVEEVRNQYAPEFFDLYRELDEEGRQHLEDIGYDSWIEDTADRASEYVDNEVLMNEV